MNGFGSMTIDIVEIGYDNRGLIPDFCEVAGSSLKTFRYFDSRSFDVVENHLVTYIMMRKNVIIGYGHLDIEDDKVWLGVCITEGHTGYGYGKKMMEALIAKAHSDLIEEINLSVDKDNTPAIAMYSTLGFVVTSENEKVYFMKMNLGEANG